MKQGWPILLLSVTGISALTVILCWTFRPREPAYQGRPLSYWVESDGQSPWIALHEIGPGAIPFLLARIRRENSVSQGYYRKIYLKLPVTIQRKLPVPHAEPAGIGSRTLHYIHAIGPSAVPALMPALSNTDIETRWLATVGIGIVGYGMDGPVTPLMQLTKDPNQKIRAAALQSLGRMGPGKKRAIPAVLQALEKDPVPQVRSAAAWALLGIGSDENGLVVRALTRAMADQDPSTRQWSALGLWWATGDPNVIAFLISELEGAADEGAWRRILPVLGQAGELASDAVPIISARIAELENTFQPLGEEDALPSAREVLCQINSKAAERCNGTSQ